MKKAIVFILLILIFFAACDKPVPRPSDLIDRDDFTDILTETYLYKNLGHQNIKFGQYDLTKEEAYILKSRGVDWQQFKDSYSYYMTDEKSAAKINDAVRKNLEMMIPKNEETEIKKEARNRLNNPANSENIENKKHTPKFKLPDSIKVD